MEISIKAPVEIVTDVKYCDKDCAYFETGGHYKSHSCRWPSMCNLFMLELDNCLGGGPLRCQACLEAEKQNQEGK